MPNDIKGRLEVLFCVLIIGIAYVVFSVVAWFQRLWSALFAPCPDCKSDAMCQACLEHWATK